MAKLQNKNSKRASKSKQAFLERIRLKAAGIDIGSDKIFIAIMDETVKSFTTFTSGIQELLITLGQMASPLLPWKQQEFIGFPYMKY